MCWQLIEYDSTVRDSIWPEQQSSVSDYNQKMGWFIPMSVKDYFDALLVNFHSFFDDMDVQLQATMNQVQNLTTNIQNYNTWTTIDANFIKLVSICLSVSKLLQNTFSYYVSKYMH